MVFALLFVACEGPVGPQGPQGEQGVRGNYGPSGHGVELKTVTRKMSKSDFRTNSLTDYRPTAEYDLPEITRDDKDRGLVVTAMVCNECLYEKQDLRVRAHLVNVLIGVFSCFGCHSGGF